MNLQPKTARPFFRALCALFVLDIGYAAPEGTDKAFTMNAGETITITSDDWGFSDQPYEPGDLPNNFVAVTLGSVPAEGQVKVDGVIATIGQEVSMVAIVAGNEWTKEEKHRFGEAQVWTPIIESTASVVIPTHGCVIIAPTGRGIPARGEPSSSGRTT